MDACCVDTEAFAFPALARDVVAFFLVAFFSVDFTGLVLVGCTTPTVEGI